MPYWRVYYHLVWATHERQPLIAPDIEESLYRVIAGQCKAQRGHTYAVNGMPDHVHVMAAIPPSLSVAHFVKNLKGTSSRFVTAELGRWFQWQRGYGVFSVSERNIKQAIDYVRGQKEHHANGSITDRLERWMVEDDGPPDLIPG